jgi:CspA family cold shock protein
MAEGTVKFFNRTKNFGFINGDDGKSYFVHATGLKQGTSIDEGDRVSFDASEGEKGPKAENVEKSEGNKEEKAEEAEAEEAEAPAEEATEEVAEEEKAA